MAEFIDKAPTHAADPDPIGVLLIGHLTRDLIRVGQRSTSAPGGAVHYAGVTYAKLGQSTRVITKAARADADELAAPLRSAGCAVHVIDSPATTEFENVLTEDLRARSQRVLRVAEPFQTGDAAFEERPIVHLGPLTNGEMDIQFVRETARRAAALVLDVQGFVRERRGDRVEPAAWPEAAHVLALCDVVKADDAEASSLTGLRDPARAALALHERGAREVLVTMAHQGSYLAVDGAVHAVPALPAPQAVDSTGAGDTYTAAYVSARLRGQPPLDAARFASAAAALSLVHTGPFSATRDAVERHLLAH